MKASTQDSHSRLLEIVTVRAPRLLEYARSLLPASKTGQVKSGSIAQPANVTDTQRILALLEALYLGAIADGELSEDERDHLCGVMVELFGGTVKKRDASEIIACFVGMHKQDGFDARLKAVAAALPDAGSRKAAFQLAAGSAWTDEESPLHERDALHKLAVALAIPADQAAAITAEMAQEMGHRLSLM